MHRRELMGRASSPSDLELVRALRALADPTRFRMVQTIAAAGELTCGQVQERFDVSQPTISHHLKILADTGVVVMRSQGKHHLISVDHGLLKSLVELIPARLGPPGKQPRKASAATRPRATHRNI